MILAAGGVLLAHSIGYAVAHAHEALPVAPVGEHAYLTALTWLVAPAAIVALLRAAVRHARSLDETPITALPLASVMLGMLAVQEIVERIPAHDVSGVLHEPAVWWSAAAAIGVAWLLARLVHSVGEAVGRILRRRHRRPRRSVTWRPAASRRAPRVAFLHSTPVRGPPQVTFT